MAARGADSLAALVNGMATPRTVWVMLPAGEITEQTITALESLLAPGDTIIDGGNTFWQDDIRRAKRLAAKGCIIAMSAHRAACGDWSGAIA